MTHFPVIVMVPGDADVDAAVAKQLQPFDENGEWGRDGSRWDWWQIGGRFSGLLSPGYDPAKDPANIEDCDFCDATGTVAEATGASYPAWRDLVGKPCPNCGASGKALKFTSEWAERRDLNARPVGDVPWSELQYLPAILTPDGTWHEQVEGGYGMFAIERGPKKADDAWATEALALTQANPDAIAVLVDCHV